VSAPNDTQESPDYFVTPTKGVGTKSVNWIPKAIGMVFAAMVLLGMAYTAHDRSLEMQRSARVDEETKNVNVAAPPVKKPPGPDVMYPAAMAAAVNQPYAMGQPMMVDEAAKQAAAKKAAELDAAMKSSPEVEKFVANKQQAHTPQPLPGYPRLDGLVPPPPPDQYDQDGMGNGSSNQDQKRDFLKAKNDYSPYLKHTREQALSEYEIKAGFFIPGIMISGINSDLPGLLVGQVRQNVYDSATGRHLLIPAGARLVGTYDSAVSGGQESVLVAWNRVIYPDGSSVFLDTMPGADQLGIAGFKDQVNNHYLRTFGQAFMLSLFSAGMQLSQPRGAVAGTYNAQQIGAAALGQQMAQLGMQIARRNLNMQPTLEIRPGYTFNIMVNKDIILPPWRGHPAAQKTSNQEVEVETSGSGSY
jgi:type IV secretory pathway VirB10-like protein